MVHRCKIVMAAHLLRVSLEKTKWYCEVCYLSWGVDISTALGTWVAAVGAIFSLVVAIYLAWIGRRTKLQIEFAAVDDQNSELRFFDCAFGPTFHEIQVRLVNLGPREIKLNRAPRFRQYLGIGGEIPLDDYVNTNSEKKRLEEGDEAIWSVPPTFISSISEAFYGRPF